MGRGVGALFAAAVLVAGCGGEAQDPESITAPDGEVFDLQDPAVDLPLPTCVEWDGALRLHWRAGETRIGHTTGGGEGAGDPAEEARYDAARERLEIGDLEMEVGSGAPVFSILDDDTTIAEIQAARDRVLAAIPLGEPCG